ncbi:pilus assembly protein [Sphingopyxis indica]|uniref:TadE/TadG family type IV pilus assembly protein n=1 Tax=Sphingopyxis indica TaxID=436663 RepID=UPI0029391AAC|nr:pilus assembly protein [Sphingopyxis indica]WOF43066.1 pilus assembly protein [Sphingopyxis indica]
MLKRFSKETTGIAMVEFAIVLPIMLILFVSAYVIADMVACYQKVTIATRALTDLVSTGVSPSRPAANEVIAAYIGGAQLVLAPFDRANATLQISELRVCDATHAFVIWSHAQTGTAPTTPSQVAGTVVVIPPDLITGPMIPSSPDGSNVCNNATGSATVTQVGTAGGYLFFGQVVYVYTPAISYGQSGTIALADKLYMSPRQN